MLASYTREPTGASSWVPCVVHVLLTRYHLASYEGGVSMPGFTDFFNFGYCQRFKEQQWGRSPLHAPSMLLKGKKKKKKTVWALLGWEGPGQGRDAALWVGSCWTCLESQGGSPALHASVRQYMIWTHAGMESVVVVCCSYLLKEFEADWETTRPCLKKERE